LQQAPAPQVLATVLAGIVLFSSFWKNWFCVGTAICVGAVRGQFHLYRDCGPGAEPAPEGRAIRFGHAGGVIAGGNSHDCGFEGDYGYASKIRRKYSDIQFVTVDDIQDGLIAVSTGKADALLCTLAQCSYTISELGLTNVRVVRKTEFDTKLALEVQKHLTELVSILNKAIASITPGQQQAILDSWIKQKYAAGTDYTLVYQVIVIAVVLSGIAVLWNRRLSQEIDLRAATCVSRMVLPHRTKKGPLRGPLNFP
jgi:hypothetical protein